jgi:hypothetical protein
MKYLKASAFSLLLSACLLHASAQDIKVPQVSEPDLNKPKLFKDLPDRIVLKLQSFDGIFNMEVGKTINLPISSNFVFSGSVVSKAEDPNSNVKSIVIKSSNRIGATFALTRIINANNTITYSGRIMSFKHGDAYEIVSENGSYYLVKKGLYDLYDE